MPLTIHDEVGLHYDKLVSLLKEYFSRNGDSAIFDDKNITVIIPKDIKRTLIENELSSALSFYTENDYHAFGGRMLTPKTREAKDYVVIFQNYLFESEQYFSTVYHEFTHVKDFTQYFNLYGNVCLLDTNTRNMLYYWEFYFWTEYNAKKIGLERLVEELAKDGSKIYFKGTIEAFVNDYNPHWKTQTKIYELVHFFARISIHDHNNDLTFEDVEFPIKFVIEHYGQNAIVFYFLIKNIKTFDDFELMKDSIAEHIEEIWELLDNSISA